MINNTHHRIEAFIEHDELDWTADGELCQLIIMTMLDESEELDPAVCALKPAQARNLAFGLLVCAEHADRLARETER
ncbi:MAG: hypothetical protein ACXVII_40110 [Solirubrobacteraceae bacterium]